MRGPPYSIMNSLSPPPSLKEEEDGSADNGDEVEGKVQKVSNQSLDAKPAEGILQSPPQSRNGIIAGLELSSLLYELALVARQEGAIECVEEGILEKIVPSNHVDNCGTLIEDEEPRRDNGQGPIDKYENAELGQVGEREHAGYDSAVEGQILGQFGDKGLPEGSMPDKVHDAFEGIEP
jgi:hypothetical protein